MVALALLSQLAVASPATVEIWPISDGGYQHRVEWTGRASLSVGDVTASAHLGLTWWGRPDAKIKGSPLNLEASRVLERRHGVSASLDMGTCAVGAAYRRRGVEGLDVPRVWGTPERPGSIGYHDGILPTLSCGPVSVAGPLVRVQALTLPWHDWYGSVEVPIGPLRADASVAAGGPRETAYDIGVALDTGPVDLGFRWGRIAGPYRPLERSAFTLSIGGSP